MERYKTFNSYLKNKFNTKVIKIPLDAHPGCPHKINGGCSFCKDYSKSNVANTNNDLISQFNEGIKTLKNKWPNAKYIAYFQSGTNTFIPLEKFKKNLKPFLENPDVVGISIGTRCDSISDEYYKYFKYLNTKTFLSIELGLQSSKDETLKLINRGHDKDSFTKTVQKLKSLNIFVCVHIINGLPYEEKEDMLNTIKYLNSLNIDAIKIHLLSVLKDTPLAKLYEEKPFTILSKDEYINILLEQIKLLNPNIIIERLTGDPLKEDVIEPTWYTYKKALLNDINKALEINNIFQGKN